MAKGEVFQVGGGSATLFDPASGDTLFDPATLLQAYGVPIVNPTLRLWMGLSPDKEVYHDVQAGPQDWRA